MRNEIVSRPLCLHLLACLAEGQRLGLREHVCEQHIVMTTERVQRAGGCDEVAGIRRVPW